jgi:hypothetical protein
VIALKDYQERVPDSLRAVEKGEVTGLLAQDSKKPNDS